MGVALEGIGVHRDGPPAALVDWRARRLRCRHAVRAVERPAVGTAVTGGRRVATRSDAFAPLQRPPIRSEEHTSELQSLMRISYAVFCLQTKNLNTLHTHTQHL